MAESSALATHRRGIRLVAFVIIAVVAIGGLAYFLTVRDYGTLKVKVVKMDNTPLPRVALNLVKADKAPGSSPDHTLQTDSNGLATIQIPAGSYVIHFDAKASPRNYKYPDPLPVTVQSQATVEKLVQLAAVTQSEKKATLQVRVVRHDGTPAPDVEVGLWTLSAPPEKPDKGFKKTDQLGLAIFDIMAGDYILGFNPDSLPAEYVLPDKTLVTLSEGSNEKIVTLNLMP